MAAFDLIENYLTKYVISPGDTILIPNYIYFESEEQVKKIPGINFVKGNSYNTRDIIQMILTTSAKVVLIDPLTNSLELNLIDLKTIVEEIAQKIDHKVYFVIDGTMLS